MSPTNPFKPASRIEEGTEPLHPDSIVEAAYEPRDRDRDPACAWAAHLVGLRSKWLVRFVLDTGPHAGQWALSPYPLADSPAGCWVPSGHFREVRVLGELFDEHL